MIKEAPRGEGKFQAQWDRMSESLGPQFYPYYNLHRQRFQESHPLLPVRGEYDHVWDPTLKQMLNENPENVDFLLRSSPGDKALVIGASGFSFLNALTNDLKEIDLIDIDPAQVAWNYSVAAFIALTPREELGNALREFENTRYEFRDYFSIRLPKIRSEYLKRLPDALDILQVPQEMREAVAQNFNYYSFYFDKDMGNSTQKVKAGEQSVWDRFYRNYDAIRQRILEKKGWSFSVADLTDWLAAHPEEYDVVYTSNVYQFIRNRIGFWKFAELLVNSLKHNGIGNIYDNYGLPSSSSTGLDKFTTVTRMPGRKGSIPNWLVLQKK